MDNLTHSLVGLAAAKAGLEKLSPGATVVCSYEVARLLHGNQIFIGRHDKTSIADSQLPISDLKLPGPGFLQSLACR